jgi:replicative DNA helicase
MSQVDGQKLRLCKSLKDEDWSKIASNTGLISKLPIEINDTISTVQEIRAYCRELRNRNALDVLIIDYLQLMRTLKKCESRRVEVDDISRQLKEMSLEFHIPIIALSQLSRESVEYSEPELHHLKESGSLEQDADNVFFLHVPKDTDEFAESFDLKIIIGKQRNGATGFIFLRYFRKTFRFYNIAR